MSLADFFSPVDIQSFTPKDGFYSSQLGQLIDIHSNGFPDLDEHTFDIAFFGVLDGRNSVKNHGCGDGPDHIRQKLYQLHQGGYNTRIVDLGNIKAGHKVADTYVAVKVVVAELIKKNILPIILGGGQDLTYAQYMAYEELEQKADLVVIDPRLDIDETTDGTVETTSQSYLNKIFIHEPNYLFNFSNVGYQTYFVNQDSLRMMEKVYFDVHRLGEFTGNIQSAEPIIRNANLLSFDISAVRSSDACGNGNASPNGFYGEDACQLCRYAGMNDKLTSIGFYEYNPSFDRNEQTATLLSQMIWYFIDGFYNRKKELPLQPKSQYLIYRASIKGQEHELVFVKSKRSDRWWMQVPYPSGLSQNERYHLVPCTYDDYQLAVSGEMPDLWWRTHQKLF
ncbi:MAG: arginase [Sphingobacteriaceae bacterium]|jgi:arginase family enzyme|nr:arginase [Sphingobacteriaceae bacterium]